MKNSDIDDRRDVDPMETVCTEQRLLIQEAFSTAAITKCASDTKVPGRHPYSIVQEKCLGRITSYHSPSRLERTF